ncbi:MAG: ANTAR domain-containing protein [Nocardioidaceae bacterium]|nr:ANTAR domain-containing protein [Nocardioidaceae bacterium]
MTTEETGDALSPASYGDRLSAVAFQYDTGSDSWTWSPHEMRTLRLDPQQLIDAADSAGTFGLLLEPDRRDSADHDGAGWPVLVVVGEVTASGGDHTLLRGYVLDLSTAFHLHGQRQSREAVAAVLENRATIEQAKGALMTAHGYDAGAAMRELRAWSSRRNVKLRVIAEGLVAEVVRGAGASGELVTRLDGVIDEVSRTSADDPEQ